MRSHDEIRAEYTQLCAQMGDIALKRRDLDEVERRVLARVDELNVEARLEAEARASGGVA
jgi:hypothetical protein